MKFSIDGECVPKGRPRFTKTGHTFTPQKTRDYEKLVRDEFIKELPNDYSGFPLFKEGEPVTVHIVVGVGIPKSFTKKQRALIENDKLYPTKKPDIDNCVKAILDALNGYAYADDKQVCSITSTKMYSEFPSTTVWIERWDI